MGEVIVFIFDIFCWIGLIVLGVIFASRQRKKTLQLRSFVKLARNQSPERWTATKGVKGLPRKYSTKIAGFYLVIEKHPKKGGDNGVIRYSYRMFVSKENKFYVNFRGRKPAELYELIDREQRRPEEILEKWRRLSEKERRKNGALISA